MLEQKYQNYHQLLAGAIVIPVVIVEPVPPDKTATGITSTMEPGERQLAGCMVLVGFFTHVYQLWHRIFEMAMAIGAPGKIVVFKSIQVGHGRKQYNHAYTKPYWRICRADHVCKGRKQDQGYPANHTGQHQPVGHYYDHGHQRVAVLEIWFCRYCIYGRHALVPEPVNPCAWHNGNAYTISVLLQSTCIHQDDAEGQYFKRFG